LADEAWVLLLMPSMPRISPGKVEAGHLLAAVVGGLVGLEGAGPHGEHRLKVVALAIQVLAFLQRLAALDDLVELVDFPSSRVRKAGRWN
jgi:hypothetical protein